MISLVQAFNDHSALFFVLAVISVIIVGISKSGFGAGLGILSLPLMASQSSINEALAILLPLLIAIDLVGLRRFLRNADWRILKLVLLPAAFGMFLGYLFFLLLPPKFYRSQLVYLPHSFWYKVWWSRAWILKRLNHFLGLEGWWEDYLVLPRLLRM